MGVNRLLNCPTCSHEISRYADPCPHCGKPFAGQKAVKLIRIDNEAREKQRKDLKNYEKREGVKYEIEKKHPRDQQSNQQAEVTCLILSLLALFLILITTLTIAFFFAMS